MRTGPPGPVHAVYRLSVGVAPDGHPPGPRAYAEKDVPQPQLDFALGLTKVKPPVRPSVT